MTGGAGGLGAATTRLPVARGLRVVVFESADPTAALEELVADRVSRRSRWPAT